MENSFKITGFVGFSEEKAFNNSSVCRFSISVSRKEKDTDNWTSAFLNCEAWVKNEEVEKFATLQKGNRVTVEARSCRTFSNITFVYYLYFCSGGDYSLSTNYYCGCKKWKSNRSPHA